jgi:hypothetical protein
MRSRVAALVFSGVVGMGLLPAANVWPPTWGDAVAAPGLAGLNVGGVATVSAFSCPTSGNCSAGGSYADAGSDLQAYVVDEVDGVWQPAEEVPGTAALNYVPPGLNFDDTAGADVDALACTSAGNCSAGGGYDTNTNTEQAFVVNEIDGVWQHAAPVGGMPPWYDGDVVVDAMSCGAPGDCTAGGSIDSGSLAFVVAEADGHWGDLQVLARQFAADGVDEITSLNCHSAGECEALGTFNNQANPNGDQVFDVTELHGAWGRATPLPHLETMNTGDLALSFGLSCPRAGDCTTGGFYVNAKGGQAWVDDQVDGRWSEAEEVPGTARLNHGETDTSIGADTVDVSCAAPGACSASGFYVDANGNQQPFVASEVRGAWGRAQGLPGDATLNSGGNGLARAIACPKAGDCVAAGRYLGKTTGYGTFVATEVGGVWGPMQPVGGVVSGSSDAEIDVLTCPSLDSCTGAGGYNTLIFNPSQVFFVTASTASTPASERIASLRATSSTAR